MTSQPTPSRARTHPSRSHGRLCARTRSRKARAERRRTPPPTSLVRAVLTVPQALSFVLSPFAAPAYNLPIFLFGALVHESSDALQSLKLVNPSSSPKKKIAIPNSKRGPPRVSHSFQASCPPRSSQTSSGCSTTIKAALRNSSSSSCGCSRRVGPSRLVDGTPPACQR